MTPGVQHGAVAFEAFVGLLDYPMFVVTSADGEQRAGCLVGFTTQVSIGPPRFLVGLSDKNHTSRVAARASHLAVHVLNQRSMALARLFGEETGDTVDKLARCAWRPGPGGVPVLEEAAAWFAGAILERLPLGDHIGFVLEPQAGQVREAIDRPLTLADMSGMEPGHGA